MSTLLIDIGNTRIKWALLKRDGVLQRQRASAYADWTVEIALRTIFGKTRRIDRLLAVSVAPDSINRIIVDAARARGIGSEAFVESSSKLGGVRTRYVEPWRLGADRLVAAIGAFAIAGKRGACVVDVGTAMTLDVVDGKGVHLGGSIVPGPELMVRSLLTETNGIQRRAVSQRPARARNAVIFARNTAEAINSGSRFAAAAAIDRAVVEAKARLGRMPMVLLTGGAAYLVRPLLRTHGIVEVPDLVLRGLAELAKTPLR